jgi:hypothetical protein
LVKMARAIAMHNGRIPSRKTHRRSDPCMATREKLGMRIEIARDELRARRILLISQSCRELAA